MNRVIGIVRKNESVNGLGGDFEMRGCCVPVCLVVLKCNV